MDGLIIAFLAPLWGAILEGIQRKLKARMQNRIGPPILQPIYDMVKLINKETFIVNSTHIWFGLLYFLTLWVALFVLFGGGNILYAIYIHLLASIFFVLAGFSVKSIFSNIGSNRKLLSLIAYEPILILACIALYLHYGSFEVALIQNSQNNPFILIFTFLSVLFIVPIITKLSPFDAVKAHQEIVGGVEVEFGGIFYEIIYMAKFMEMIFIYTFIFILFGNSFVLAALLVIFSFLLVNLVDNSTTRVKINDMLRLTYIFALPLSLIGIVLVVLWH